MKNLILYSLLLFSLMISAPVNSFSQAHDIKIESGQNKDSLYVMLTDTVESKYRWGKGKWVNATSAHAKKTFDGCKTYTAVLSQASTSAPTAAVLRNTLGGTPSWTYTGVGVYTAELDDVFTANKTCIFATVGNATGLVVQSYSITDSTMVVKIFNDAGVAANLAGTCTFECRVYP